MSHRLSFAALFFPVAKVTGFGDLGGVEFSAVVFGGNSGACFHRVRVGSFRVEHRLLTALRGCRRGSGFFNGLLVGLYPIALIGYNAYNTLLFGRPEGDMLPAWHVVWFLIGMTSVGVAEEFLFRGVIAQTLLEHFGTSRAGVWKACLLSALLFGAAHLTNLTGSAPLGVLMQCVFAASLGTLLAAVYFRTGNIWVTVFIHAAMDITSMLIGGLYGTQTVADSIITYDITMLTSIAVYLIPTAFLLRKKKLSEVELYFGRDMK